MPPDPIQQQIRDLEAKIRLLQGFQDQLIGSDRYIFRKDIEIFNGRNFILSNETGTKFGTAIDQLMSFYGVTPVNQPATVTDAATQGGTYSQADVQSIATAVNTVIDRLQELGLIA